jgi:hypothetical protein
MHHKFNSAYFQLSKGRKKYIFSSNVFQFYNIRIYINSHIQRVRKTGFIEQETTELFMVSQHEFDDLPNYLILWKCALCK